MSPLFSMAKIPWSRYQASALFVIAFIWDTLFSFFLSTKCQNTVSSLWVNYLGTVFFLKNFALKWTGFGVCTVVSFLL
jgi:hypothetical protein